VYGLPEPKRLKPTDSPPGPPGSGKIQADFAGENGKSPLYCQPTCDRTLGCVVEDPLTSNSTSRGCTPTCPSTPRCVNPACSWDPAEKQCSCPDDGDDEVTCTTMEHLYCHFDSVDGACMPNTAASECKAIACTSLQPEKGSCVLNVLLDACEAELLKGADMIRGRNMIGGSAAPGEETLFTLAVAKAAATQNTPEAPPMEPPTFVRYPNLEVLEPKSKRKYHFMGYPENILSVMKILKGGSDLPGPPHEETTTTETPGHSGEATTTEDPANIQPPPPDEKPATAEPPDVAGKKQKKRKVRKRKMGKEERKKHMKRRGIPIQVEEDGDQPTIVGQL
jgi:hypothetical protein